MAIEQLRRRLNEAFNEARYPRGDAIVAETIDDENTKSRFVNTDWRHHISSCHDTPTSLWFFTPQAFVYFVPAFLLNLLDDIDNRTPTVGGHLVAQFTREDVDCGKSRSDMVVALLTAGQRSIIADILGYVSKRQWDTDTYTMDRDVARAIALLRGNPEYDSASADTPP